MAAGNEIETVRQLLQWLTPNEKLGKAEIPLRHCLKAQELSTHKPKPGHYTMFQSPSIPLTHNLGVSPLNPSKGPGANHS